MRRLASCFALVLAACSSSAPNADAGVGACPSLAPATGQPCSAPASCLYEHCATNGILVATCAPSDAGASSWLVTARPCTMGCNGGTCRGGSVCIERTSGAQIIECSALACGQGPLDCACACGVGATCVFHPEATDGPLVECQVGCGASVCP